MMIVVKKIRVKIRSLLFVLSLLPQLAQAEFDHALFDDDFYAWYASGNRELQDVEGNTLDFIGAKWDVFLNEHWIGDRIRL